MYFISPAEVDYDAIAFGRMTQKIDPQILLNEITPLLTRDWVDHINQRCYQGGWDVLPLRALSEHFDAHPILQSFAIEAGNNWKNLAILAQCPNLNSVLDNLHCPIKSVRLMRLKPGAYIKPHRDQGLCLEQGEARLHLPIQTSDKLEFKVNQRVVPMKAGELWYINANLIHSVDNQGEEERVNLVIDCVVNSWLLKQLQLDNVYYESTS